MKYLLAVSGGIDSVVLLDMLARAGEHELVVAHFDHGIREDSAADARFVEALARRYGVPFVSQREELGADAGEELARKRRYAFLRAEADKHEATIATAHHADDIVETVAINLIRGTGWRGLAVLDAPGVARPLLHLSKQNIRQYALANRLEWVEDSTNAGDVYLRNRVRRRIAETLPGVNKRKLLNLRQEQRQLKRAINREAERFLHPDGTGSRYFFSMIDPLTASELLRGMVFARGGTPPTRPQCERAVLAIKTAAPQTAHHIGAGVRLRFTARHFSVETS